MGKREGVLIGVILVCVSLLGVFIFQRLSKKTAHENIHCGERSEPVKMIDPWMKGRLDPALDYVIRKGWYTCHPLERDDVVVLRPSAAFRPETRVLAAIPGDHFSLIALPRSRGWNIEINGHIYRDSEGKPYHFGSGATPALALHTTGLKGVVDADSAIVFSTVSPGAVDSGSLGMISVRDILGRVEAQ